VADFLRIAELSGQTPKMGIRLGLGLVAVACAVAACSGEVGTGDRGSPIEGLAGAPASGAAGSRATGVGGSDEGSGGPSQGSAGTSQGSAGTSQGSGGTSQGVGGSRAMGTSGTNSPGGAGGAASTGDAGQSASDVTASDADLQFCVDENNRYRATVSSAPLTRSSTLEAFAATGAQVDYAARVAHTHFTTSKGVPGSRASGENEIPGFGGWNLKKFKTLHDVIAGGLLDMWNEGPGGGHYENIKSTKFTQVGCGVFVAANGDVTVTMDYTN
jgi:uncharacterized protein YkwD